MASIAAALLLAASAAAFEPLYLQMEGEWETVYNISTSQCNATTIENKTADETDSMPIAWFNRLENQTYMIAAASGATFPNVGPSLNQVSHRCDHSIFNSTMNLDPSSYANWQWLQSVHMFPNGTGYGLVHNEFHGFSRLENATRYCSLKTDRSHNCNLWSTGLAYTVDGGKNFRLIAEPPEHLVAALPYQYTRNQSTTGTMPLVTSPRPTCSTPAPLCRVWCRLDDAARR